MSLSVEESAILLQISLSIYISYSCYGAAETHVCVAFPTIISYLEPVAVLMEK